MDFLKIFILLALTVLFFVNDSTQFLVANCVWDDALSGAPLSDLKGFVLSDADACALFCSKPGASAGASTDATTSPNVALCDRCCKSSQPPSKPGELLVSILHTLLKAFGTSKNPQSQTGSSDTGPGGNSAPASPPEIKPPPEPTPPPPPPPPPPPAPTSPPEPAFDDDDDDNGGGVEVPLDTRFPNKGSIVVDRFNNQNFEPGPSTSGPRRNRAYPEARIFEITGREDTPSFSDGFDRVRDRGPGWPHPASDFRLKGGTIR